MCDFSNVATGTLVTLDPLGDCQRRVCNGSGGVVFENDDNDKPSTGGNTCVDSVCTAGAPSNPPFARGTTCGMNNGTECDGSGHCVQCVDATDCPGADTDCQKRTCTSGVCGIFNEDPGTPTPPQTQTDNDCKRVVCDGNGSATTMADDTDLPINTNDCRTAACVSGVPMTPPKPHGTTCPANGTQTCDGAGACITSFNVLRLSGTLSGGVAAAIALEERTLDGTLIGTTALPTTASGGNLAIVESGSASSEGSLSRSGDGRYLIVAGYNAAVGTASVASAPGIDRIVARVDAASPANVNSTTTISQNVAFTANNVRGATSQDGTGFWVSGAGTSMVTTPPPPSFDGGVWWVNLGGSGLTQITMPSTSQPTNTRWLHIFGGQLYASASNGTPPGNFFSVFAVGTGLPTTGGQTANLIPGLPTATASPFSFVFFDRDPMVSGFDTLYISDDGNGTFQGIEKWTLAQGATSWARVATFNLSPAVDFKGVAGLVTGNNVTLIGTTDEGTSSRIVVFVDTGTGSPTGSVIATSAAGQIYRGVALSPHL
jgi:hypothetical protein